ncbi:MAG: ComEC/Rec2 family competence protein [Oscillospiraceae bacterium]|nr:ComEC/Rec2 family competence protein [Oscillospiraceae bacterium]MDD4414427.1 ComEC/Rec2 family competence protein [Oscillospiraceae bacterium]
MLNKKRLTLMRSGIAALISITVISLSACCFFGGQSSSLSSAPSSVPSSAGSLLEVHIIDVGNADAILVYNRDDSLLIDAGENDDGDDVVNFLRSHGVKSLDYAIATHPDADHIGGMDTVIEEIPIETFIMSDLPENIIPKTKTYRDLMAALDSKDLNITPARAGDSHPLGDAVLNILGPTGVFNSTNSMSVVCRIDHGIRRFLFMGDAEKDAEDVLMASKADLKADFIKIGHHGSRSSSQEKFIKAVDPQYAAISCGGKNRYKHPHAQTLELLSFLEIVYYRTDIFGTIALVSDGSYIKFNTEKNQPPSTYTNLNYKSR